MDNKSPIISPGLVLIFGILAVSTSSLMIKIIQKEVPSLVIAFYRLIIASTIMGFYVIISKRKELSGISKKEMMVMGLSGVFLAVHFASWITSLEYTSIVSSVMLVSSTPLWVALLSPLIIKEKPGKYVWTGLLFTLVGALIIGLSGNLELNGTGFMINNFISQDQKKELLGNGLALLGAWGAAGYLMAGRGVRKRISITPYTFIVYGAAAIIMLVIVLFLRMPVTGYSWETYGWLASLGIVPQLIGHTSFNWALGYVNATIVSVSMLGEPIGTTILSFLILKEVPTVMEIIGGVFILVGIYITSIKEK